MVKKLIHIIIGNFNNLFKRNNELYKQRILICNECEEKIIIAGTSFCGKCGCPLASKTRVPDEKCLMNKW